MSPDHQTSVRVYRGLKADVLSGALGEGRLNLAVLEERYLTSATPVREALLRLVGEGLVDLLHRGGFGIHGIDEEGLKELYELNLRVLVSVTSWRTRSSFAIPGAIELSSALRPPFDSLFLAVAESSGSATLVALVGALNDRLHRIRLTEARTLPGTAAEYESITAAALIGQEAALRRALTAYHRRRVRLTSKIFQNMTA